MLGACLLLIAAPVRAQVPEFPDSLRGESIVARTERFASTHTTSLSTDYTVGDGPFTALLLSHLLSSTTLVGLPSTKDQVDLRLDATYALPGAMRLFSIAEGTLTNDLRGTALIPGFNNTGAFFLALGGRVTGRDSNRIGVAVGGVYNRQLNVEDAGGGVYGEILGAADLGGYQLRVEGEGRWFNIAPRHNSNGFIDVAIDREFEEGGRGGIALRLESIATDNYVRRAEESIIRDGGLTYDGVQARREGRIGGSTTLMYPVDEDLGFELRAAVGSGAIGQRELSEGLPPLPRDPDPYRYQRDELAIATSFGMLWTPRRTMLNLRLDYSTNEQRNAVDPNGEVSPTELKRKRETSAQNDFVSQQLLFSGAFEHLLAVRDTVGAGASVGIYRYDTPSITNYFDKDEQTIQAELWYGRSFSPWLSFRLVGQAFLTHLVYLYGQNSNDNNWNRIFRLSPQVTIGEGESFRNMFEAEVYANYTAYDFEGRTQNIRGRSFRELRLRDSLAVGLGRSLGLIAGGEIRISERGSFSWEQFAESMLERIRTEGLDLQIRTGAVPAATFGVGARFSRVKSFRVDGRGELLPASDRISFGPTAAVEVLLVERTRLVCSGWWEHIFDEGELVSRTPSLFLTLGMKLQ